MSGGPGSFSRLGCLRSFRTRTSLRSSPWSPRVPASLVPAGSGTSFGLLFQEMTQLWTWHGRERISTSIKLSFVPCFIPCTLVHDHDDNVGALLQCVGSALGHKRLKGRKSIQCPLRFLSPNSHWMRNTRLERVINVSLGTSKLILA